MEGTVRLTRTRRLVLRGDLQETAVRHGVPRVHRQVHDHLLELGRVRAHPHRSVGAQRGETDVLPDEPLEHPPHLAHEVVQVHDLWTEHLLPAERQELPGELGRAAGRPLDLGNLVAARVPVCEARAQDIRVAHDRGELVVEVVGDPAGQPPHGFHLLRLDELLLRALEVLEAAAQLPDELGLSPRRGDLVCEYLNGGDVVEPDLGREHGQEAQKTILELQGRNDCARLEYGMGTACHCPKDPVLCEGRRAGRQALREERRAGVREGHLASIVAGKVQRAEQTHPAQLLSNGHEDLVG